jgi:hypothetical protein
MDRGRGLIAGLAPGKTVSSRVSFYSLALMSGDD